MSGVSMITPLKIVRLKNRNLQPPRLRPAPSARGMARRRWLVLIAKRALPLAALGLLVTVALWPELNKDATRARVAFRRGMVDSENGQLTHARYNGVDERERPYTVTADTARQITPDRIDLKAPIGDLTLGNTVWLHGNSSDGVYMQQSQQLDLSGNVTLYRDDGMTLLTDAATLDLKASAVASAAKVHAEGPFGALDAQGFSMFEGGAVIQFYGPSRLVLNGATR